MSNSVSTKSSKGSHLYVIGTLGFGFALAVLLDAIFGGSNEYSKEVKTSIPNQITSPTSNALTSSDFDVNEGTITSNEKRKKNRNKLDTYVDEYLTKQEQEKRKEEQEILNQINGDAYLGDGSNISRRRYLIQQAYKASREAAPVVSIKPFYDANDEALQDLLDEYEREKEEEEKDTEELAEIIDELGGVEESENKEKAIEFTKEEWAAKDRELMHHMAQMPQSSY